LRIAVHGQGHETAFVRILSEGLGVAGERIRIHEGDPDLPVVGNGTAARARSTARAARSSSSSPN